MQAREAMTTQVVPATPDATVSAVAKLLIHHNCGKNGSTWSSEAEIDQLLKHH
jgi:CBS domain-containing protein